jgi:hypothetical protein
MINKFICFIVGHNFNLSKCPVTLIETKTCSRCFPKKHTSAMNFT